MVEHYCVLLQSHAIQIPFRLMALQFLILPPSDPNSLIHQKELGAARARAHAAKIGHLRRRNKARNLLSREQIQDVVEEDIELEFENIEEVESESLSPRSIVDNGRKEPFRVWSLDLMDGEHELLETYIYV